MSHAGSKHPDPEDLALIAEDHAHPQYAHVQGCVRCTAALAQYETFLREDPIPAGADVDRAQHVLAQALLEEMAPPPERVVWWQRLTGGGMLRPALGLAVVVVGLGLAVILQQDSPETGLVLRGDDGGDSLSLAPPQLLDDAVQLRWGAVDGAEGYLVRFYSASLQEVGQRRVETAELIIPRADLRGFGHDRLLWRVSALISGDEVETSRVGTLSLDPR